MSAATSVLIVDDDAGFRELLTGFLAGEGYAVASAASAEEGLLKLGVGVGLVLLDMRMPGIGGLGFLEALASRAEKPAVLVLTAFAEVKDAVRAMQLGALDYLKKPVDLAQLSERVGALLAPRAKAAGDAARFELPAGVVAESPLMKSLLGELARLAVTDAPVLLTGESGVGKEVLADLLHRWSPRCAGPFMGVNISSLPESLTESELFGHKRGAFTGATQDRVGLIPAAAGGTLFLDEIGEAPLTLQPKLLRVLETREVVALGSEVVTPVDFRLVTATNRDLEVEIEAGRFRLDLYYRLAVVAVEIPPLRERPEDILPLARRFLSAESGADITLSPGAEAELLSRSWPGNIRELSNAMRRAAILAPGDRVLPEHLPPALPGAQRMRAAPVGTSLAELERKAIFSALERADGNRTRAAEELGISRRKLLYRLAEYREGDSV